MTPRPLQRGSPRSCCCLLQLDLTGTVPADIREANMRILLRHAPTGQYFQCLEKWTSSPKKAHNFGLIARALRFAGKTGFADMELVLFLGHPDQSHLSICEAALLSQSLQDHMASQGGRAGSRKRTAAQTSQTAHHESWLFRRKPKQQRLKFGNGWLTKPTSLQRLEAIISAPEQCLASSPPRFDSREPGFR